jgi:hypothetical protein
MQIQSERERQRKRVEDTNLRPTPRRGGPPGGGFIEELPLTSFDSKQGGQRNDGESPNSTKLPIRGRQWKREENISSIPPGVLDTTTAKRNSRRLRWVSAFIKMQNKKIDPPVGRHLRQEGLNEEQARCGRLRLSMSM